MGLAPDHIQPASAKATALQVLLDYQLTLRECETAARERAPGFIDLPITVGSVGRGSQPAKRNLGICFCSASQAERRRQFVVLPDVLAAYAADPRNQPTDRTLSTCKVQYRKEIMIDILGFS